MKRRRFVYIAAVGSSALAFPFTGCETKKSVVSHPAFLHSILSKKQIKRIGQLYGSKFPEELTSENFLLKLEKAGSVTETQIEQMIRHDFETGDTIIVDGWILSKTEARQSALYSL